MSLIYSSCSSDDRPHAPCSAFQVISLLSRSQKVSFTFPAYRCHRECEELSATYLGTTRRSWTEGLEGAEVPFAVGAVGGRLVAVLVGDQRQGGRHVQHRQGQQGAQQQTRLRHAHPHRHRRQLAAQVCARIQPYDWVGQRSGRRITGPPLSG